MDRRVIAAVLVGSVLACVSLGQQPPPAPSTAPAGKVGIGGAVEKEVRGLTSDDFPEREAALARLQSLIADQVKQRAGVQQVIDDLQADLAKQEKALAMVTDEEAQAQVAGLLEMERGLTGFTIQTMSEPVERRKLLLAWGLSKEGAPIVARVFAEDGKVRLAAIKELAKLDDESAGWTLGRLINDKDGMIRAAAMAAAWTRKPQADVVAALWFRAVSGPLASSPEMRGRMMEEGNQTIKVEFPEGEPMEFEQTDDAGEFGDALLAGDVLVRLKSPLVEEKVKQLVADREKAGKNLASMDDPDWTLATHRLVEAYAVKEAIPMLAAEALGQQTEEMGGEMNGRPFMWTQRTMAIGVLAKLTGTDPDIFHLIKARDGSDVRGWQWAIEMPMNGMNGNGQADAPAVTAFFTWWTAKHGDYGVKEAPMNPIRPPGRGRGGRGINPGGPMIDPVPAPVPEVAPGAAGGAQGAAPGVAPDAPVEAPAVNPVQAVPFGGPVPPKAILRRGAAG